MNVNCYRYYAAIKTAESHRKSERLPPGFGKTTPFSLFIKENFASRKNEQPTEVFSNLTKQWKNLNEADKMVCVIIFLIRKAELDHITFQKSGILGLFSVSESVRLPLPVISVTTYC